MQNDLHTLAHASNFLRMTQTAPEFLSPEQFADMVGVARRTVYSWIAEGSAPPSVKVGRQIRFRRVDIETWLDERTDERSATA